MDGWMGTMNVERERKRKKETGKERRSDLKDSTPEHLQPVLLFPRRCRTQDLAADRITEEETVGIEPKMFADQEILIRIEPVREDDSAAFLRSAGRSGFR